MSFDLKTKIKLSGYYYKSQTDKRDCNDRRFR